MECVCVVGVWGVHVFVQDSGGVRLTLCELYMNTSLLLGVECLCPGSVCGWGWGGGGYVYLTGMRRQIYMQILP